MLDNLMLLVDLLCVLFTVAIGAKEITREVRRYRVGRRVIAVMAVDPGRPWLLLEIASHLGMDLISTTVAVQRLVRLDVLVETQTLGWPVYRLQDAS